MTDPGRVVLSGRSLCRIGGLGVDGIGLLCGGTLSLLVSLALIFLLLLSGLPFFPDLLEFCLGNGMKSVNELASMVDENVALMIACKGSLVLSFRDGVKLSKIRVRRSRNANLRLHVV